MSEYIQGLRDFLTLHRDAYLMVFGTYLASWLVRIVSGSIRLGRR